MTSTLLDFTVRNPHRQLSQQQYHKSFPIHDQDCGATTTNSSDQILDDIDFFGLSPSSFQTSPHNSGIDSTLFLDPSASTDRMKSMPEMDHLQHISPASMWLGSGPTSSYPEGNSFSPTYDPASLPRHDSGSVRAGPGQITPPEEGRAMADKAMREGKKFDSRRDSASITVGCSKRSRQDSGSSIDDEGDVQGGGRGKREKYREKNRVAAAKCRLKKKENVDILEDKHRTQSVLNSALKQSEQALRDELSFWRTQALQHTFCNCQAIQDYNHCKARNLAAGNKGGSGFRGPHRRGSVMRQSPTDMSPVSTVSGSDKRGSVKHDASDSPLMSPLNSEVSSVENHRSSVKDSMDAPKKNGSKSGKADSKPGPGPGHGQRRPSLRLSFGDSSFQWPDMMAQHLDHDLMT